VGEVEVKKRLWTVQDVAEYLGVPIGTLYDWRCKGYGPRGKRVGRYLRYEKDVVRQWFADPTRAWPDGSATTPDRDVRPNPDSAPPP
jgi:predicted DNA-binding transcriptional regulator AlpA